MPELPESLAKLLEPMSAEAPCGENLEYDLQFMELMRVAEGTPEQVMGDSVIPGEEPNWREVRAGALALFEKTRDMRLALVLMLALLKQDGLPGLRDGLGLMRGLLEKFWDQGLYPQLDPDDNNDPTFRLNVLSSLSAPPGTFGDPWKFQARLREAPLADSRQIGRFGLRDIAIASGTEEAGSLPEGKTPADMNLISAAFSEMPPEAVTLLRESAEKSIEHIRAIDTLVNEKCGSGRGPDLAGFRQLLSEAVKQLKRAGGGGDAAAEDDAGDAAPGGASGRGGRGRGAALSGEVNSPGDSIAAMEKIIRYYEDQEPSSPVPLIVRCAQRLVGKKFMEIQKILTPDAVAVLERISTEEVSSG